MSRSPATVLLRLCAASVLAPAAPLAAQSVITWLANPADNVFTNGANWSGGVAPNSTNIAAFGLSSVTNLQTTPRTIYGLRFDSGALASYTINFTSTANRLVLGAGGIVNNSAYRPVLNLDGNFQSIGSLGDAIVNFSPTVVGRVFDLRGSAGNATINLVGGALNVFPGADGSGAEFTVGGVLQQNNGSDANPLALGSLSGTGSVTAYGAAITFGQLGRDTTFAGTIETFNPGNFPAQVVKTGAGVFTLTGTIKAADGLRIEGGAIALGSDARLGTTSAVTLDGGALRATASFGGLRAITVGPGGGTLDTRQFDVALAGGFSGAGVLAKLGAGTLTLANASTNTGGFRLAEGTVSAGHDSAFGTGTLALDGGTLAFTGGARTIANAVTLSGETTLSGGAAVTFTGAWTLARSRELHVANTGVTTLTGPIGETGGPRALLRYGTGELVLTGASTYSGGTLLAEGLTRINNLSGSAFGSGAVTLAAGATLTGAGSFSGAFQNNGTYAPGNSPTLATLSSFTQGDTGVLEMELAGTTRGTGYDALDITGTFSPGGTLRVLFIGGFSPVGGETFDLFNWGSITGTFLSLELPSLAPGLSWDDSALYTSGVLSIAGTAIPEPASAAILAGLGALALAATRRHGR